MSYDAAHKCVVLYALDAAPIVDNDDGVTPSAMPTVPANPVVLGYTDNPQHARGLNNSKGYAVGQQGAAYNKRGNRTPTINVTIKPGSIAALNQLVPDANGVLPYLAIYVVVRGQYTIVYRKCKPTTVDYAVFGNGQENGEITIGANFVATAVQELGGPLTVAPSALRVLETPLMWSDFRSWVITDATGAPANYRKFLMNLSFQADYGIERKNARPDWGDDEPLSMTSYELMEHQQKISGTASLHGRLPQALFNGATRAQDWGNMVVKVLDAEAGKGFDMTLAGMFPTDENATGGDSNSEIDYSLSFTADSLAMTTI